MVVQTEASHGYEAIKPFLVSIPMPDGDNWIYDVDEMCIRDRLPTVIIRKLMTALETGVRLALLETGLCKKIPF